MSTVERANVNALLALNLKTREVQLEGIGSVLCRGLTRYEMVHVQTLEEDRQAQDTQALVYGIVDPELTADQVIEMRKVRGAMEIERLAREINYLSGVGKDPAEAKEVTKSDLPGDGDGPDA